MKFKFPNLLHLYMNLMMLGPSGQGKTTFLKHSAIEFMKKGGRVIWFDLFKSCLTTTVFVNGLYRDLSNIATQSFFAPLKNLSLSMNTELLCMLCKAQGIKITHEIKSSIFDAVKLIKDQGPDQQTITGLINFIMNQEIRSALNEYTANGSYALFDALNDQIDFSKQWLCFEVKELFDNKEMLRITMFYLLSCIESLSDGIPTVFVIDDAGHVFSSPDFRKWLSVSLNNFRKKNISFWFAFHDVADFDNEVRNTILNSCKLKIFTPNNQILSTESLKSGYQSLGLRQHQLELLGNSTPCKDYMIQDASGKTQLIDLMIEPGSVSQIVCGGSEIDSISLMEKLIAENGHDDAVKLYLKEKGA